MPSNDLLSNLGFRPSCYKSNHISSRVARFVKEQLKRLDVCQKEVAHLGRYAPYSSSVALRLTKLKKERLQILDKVQRVLLAH